MDNPNLPRLVEIPPRMQKRLGKGTMLLPAPCDVESVIRGIRKGTVMAVSQIRESLRAKYGTDSVCPLVTGIFVRISAEAAEEEARKGKARITPYWRVVKDDGSLNPKFPGGVERQAARLRDEGALARAVAQLRPRRPAAQGRVMRGDHRPSPCAQLTTAHNAQRVDLVLRDHSARDSAGVRET